MRKFALAATVLLVTLGFTVADEFQATITKVDGDKVTYQKYKKGEKGKKGEKDGDAVTLTVAKDVKIVKGKFDKEAKKLVTGDAIEGGLKNEMFTKLAEGGVGARITTSDDGKTITQIMPFGGGMKKKKDMK